MIERMDWTLKTALRAQPNPRNWVDCLPLVLLGMRAAMKEDIGFSAAEMLFGSTLRLPGEFISPMDQANTAEATKYVRQLKKTMQSLRPTPTKKSKKLPFIEPSLADSTHVFVRNDTVHKPLQPPYDGSFPVLQRNAHAFTE